MRTVRGVVTAVQEGRFRLVTEDRRVMPFVLSHRAAVEPQDLPEMLKARRVRVMYSESGHLLAAVAREIELEEWDR